MDEMQLKSLCRSFTPANVARLAGYASSEQVEPEIVMRAIGMLMDRGWGKPNQDNTHEVKGEIKVVLRKMLEDEDE